MLRAVLFDFNGVLVDDEPIHLELFQRVLAEEGIELAAGDYYARYLGFDDRGCFAALLAGAGETPSPSRLARLIARKAAYYQQRVHRDGYPFFAGAAGLVRGAAERGWTLGVVSGALREEVEGALAQEGLRRCVMVVVAAEDVVEGKPDPEGYRTAIERMNSQPPLPARLIHPHEVVAVEDSPAGIESATGAGLVTVAVANTYPAARLGAADAVVAGSAELTPARLEDLHGRAGAR